MPVLKTTDRLDCDCTSLFSLFMKWIKCSPEVLFIIISYYSVNSVKCRSGIYYSVIIIIISIAMNKEKEITVCKLLPTLILHT